MKRFCLFLCVLSCFVSEPIFAQQSDLDKIPNEQLMASYLKDLEELGYCVISQVISVEETEQLYQRVWHEYIEKAWPHCRLEDRSNWKETFPMHNNHGIFAGPAGQTQVMWDLRQDPRIVEPFIQIWNTSDLIVSMDGISIMCPPEIRGDFFDPPWPHVDQVILRRQDLLACNNLPPIDFVSESSLSTKPFTIQGQFLFEDSFEGDGGFYCIPKSHLKFNEFEPELEAIYNLDLPKEERRKLRNEYLQTLFGNNAEGKQIAVPKGSLILWDSRTIHWNQHPNKDRLHRAEPKVRMVGYVCYVPKARLTEEGRTRRKEAFETGVSTGHNPSFPDIKHTKDHISQEYEHYLEDPNYVQPKIHLTPLGESLLGQ